MLGCEKACGQCGPEKMRINLASWSETIVDGTGCECGSVSGRYFCARADVQMQNETIAMLADMIPVSPRYPLILIDDIRVIQNRRGNGLGTRTLRSVVAAAKSEGAAVIILRLGFDGSTEEGWAHAKRLSIWYQREGFHPLWAEGVERASRDILWASRNVAWSWFWRTC